MAARVSKPATYGDILALPEGTNGEILGGQLYTKARPASPHGRAITKLGGALDGPFDSGIGGPGGWLFMFEPELHLAEDVVIPDYAGWRREKMVTFPDTPFFTMPPNWVCEGLSAGIAKIDRTLKLPIHAREGVSHLWLIDARERTLEVFRLENGRYSLLATHADDETVRAEPFDAVEIELSRWWI